MTTAKRTDLEEQLVRFIRAIPGWIRVQIVFLDSTMDQARLRVADALEKEITAKLKPSALLPDAHAEPTPMLFTRDIDGTYHELAPADSGFSPKDCQGSLVQSGHVPSVPNGGDSGRYSGDNPMHCQRFTLEQIATDVGTGKSAERGYPDVFYNAGTVDEIVRMFFAEQKELKANLTALRILGGAQTGDDALIAEATALLRRAPVPDGHPWIAEAVAWLRREGVPGTTSDLMEHARAVPRAPDPQAISFIRAKAQDARLFQQKHAERATKWAEPRNIETEQAMASQYQYEAEQFESVLAALAGRPVPPQQQDNEDDPSRVDGE